MNLWRRFFFLNIRRLILKTGTALPSEAKHIVEKVRENYHHVSSDPELMESYHRQRLTELKSIKFTKKKTRDIIKQKHKCCM